MRHTVKQLALAELTLAAVLGSGLPDELLRRHHTLGLAFAATGAMFPFFSAMLGWLGVFLTGSDTSANALFGTLQVVTANKLGMNPILMASANSAGGVMGKMISLTSIAVAAAAASMKREEEAHALPLHPEAQHPAGVSHRPDRDVLRLRDALLGAVNSTLRFTVLPI